jgi:hypothetical protein
MGNGIGPHYAAFSMEHRIQVPQSYGPQSFGSGRVCTSSGMFTMLTGECRPSTPCLLTQRCTANMVISTSLRSCWS